MGGICIFAIKYWKKAIPYKNTNYTWCVIFAGRYTKYEYSTKHWLAMAIVNVNVYKAK